MRRLVVLLQVLALAVGMAACGDSPDSQDEEAPPDQATGDESLQPVTFLTNFFLLNGGYAPFYAGREQGFFEERGLDLRIELGRGSADAASQLGAGAVDFALVDTSAALLAIAAATPIKFVATYYQNYSGGVCTVAERLVIEDFDDVEGIRIAATAGDAFVEVLPAFTDVEFEHVVVEPAGYLPSLLSGEVDAMTVANYTEIGRYAEAESNGQELDCFLYGDHGVDLLGEGLATRNELLESDPDLVGRFVEAFAESVTWAAENRDEAIEIYMDANPEVTNAEIERATLDRIIEFYSDDAYDGGWFVVPREKVESSLRIATEVFGATGVTVEQVYDNRFAEALPEEWRHSD